MNYSILIHNIERIASTAPLERCRKEFRCIIVRKEPSFWCIYRCYDASNIIKLLYKCGEQNNYPRLWSV